jgi:3-isopropylmalate dehydrogenase
MSESEQHPVLDRTYEFGVIAGDGIGPELVESAMQVLDAVSAKAGFTFRSVPLAAGAEVFRATGEPMSAAAVDAVRRCDATLKGPVGLPDVRHPDGTEAGLLGGVLRAGLDLYANVRPVRLPDGVTSRLRVQQGDIDYVIVRENTEGLYASRGKGVGNHWAMTDTMYLSRNGCERISRFAFELAQRRSGAPTDGISRVTLVDKANVLASMYFFREIFLSVAAEFPSVSTECIHVDAAAAALITHPEHFDVVVTENMFGDILSDLAGATAGGIGFCPSGNIGAEAGYFEPIHGSAPSIAGRGMANPIGQILAAAMMLDYVAEQAAGDEVRRAVDAALRSRAIEVRPDGSAVGGPRAVTQAVVDEL